MILFFLIHTEGLLSHLKPIKLRV